MNYPLFLKESLEAGVEIDFGSDLVLLLDFIAGGLDFGLLLVELFDLGLVDRGLDRDREGNVVLDPRLVTDLRRIIP